jgi:protocatechuate 3,4-dioxygenase beta subunit
MGLAVLASPVALADTGLFCNETAAGIEGPYYRDGIPVRDDLDLYGDPGMKVILRGSVSDIDCNPISGAVVEVWHANPTGDYDTRSRWKEYYGQIATDSNGEFVLRTLKPGRYLNGAQYRPSHIHIKIWVSGTEVLTTQLYFSRDPYNSVDPYFDSDTVMEVIARRTGLLICGYDFVVA